MLFARKQEVLPRWRTSGHATDTGPCRAHNEDTLCIDSATGLLVVADGMGGHAAGEVASRIATETVVSAVTERGASLGDALLQAHERVLQAAADGEGRAGMGTTCVACCPGANGFDVAWVGDSRAYHCREGRLSGLTRDHSYVQSLMDAGLLTPDRAESHPHRHVLARCIGGSELTRDQVDSVSFDARPGDRVVLCSDGLTGELGDTRIAGILALYPDDQEASDELLRAAIAGGGRDNVTLIVATVG